MPQLVAMRCRCGVLEPAAMEKLGGELFRKIYRPPYEFALSSIQPSTLCFSTNSQYIPAVAFPTVHYCEDVGIHMMKEGLNVGTIERHLYRHELASNYDDTYIDQHLRGAPFSDLLWATHVLLIPITTNTQRHFLSTSLHLPWKRRIPPQDIICGIHV